MPVYHEEHRDDFYEGLVQALVNELKGQQIENGPAILLRGIRRMHPTRVYVEWQAFEGVASDVRGEIIYEACRDFFGNEAADKVELMMGLTPEEAREADIRVRG